MKQILMFDDSVRMVKLYNAFLQGSDFELHPYAVLHEAIAEVTTNRTSYDFALLDWGIENDPTAKDSAALVIECIKLGLPVMVRSNRKDGDWLKEARIRIEEGVGRPVLEKELEFSLNDETRLLKHENLLRDLKDFTVRHFPSDGVEAIT